jgi:putative iron-only hydrogenase system regulator
MRFSGAFFNLEVSESGAQLSGCSIGIPLSAAFGAGFLRARGALRKRTGGMSMETRVAVMGIIVEDPDSVERLNSILHNYAPYIIGRMGVPYREKSVSIISVAVDAPQDIISALSGKIGKLPGINVKTAYSNVGGKA